MDAKIWTKMEPIAPHCCSCSNLVSFPVVTVVANLSSLNITLARIRNIVGHDWVNVCLGGGASSGQRKVGDAQKGERAYGSNFPEGIFFQKVNFFLLQV